MTRPENKVLYQAGWKGRLGPYIVEIVQIEMKRGRMKKGKILGRAPILQKSDSGEAEA